MDGGPDTGPTPITCVDEPVGGFYNICRASEHVLATPGGPLDDGTYVMNGFWRNGGCGAGENQNEGHMALFHQDGHAYMRFLVNSEPSGGGTLSTRKGTWHLAPDGDGGMTRIELCNDGGTTTGTYERDGDGGTGTELYFRVNDYEEFWQKQ